MFDLVNLDIGGHSNGRPFDSTATPFNPSARKVNSRHSVRSKEVKAANRLIENMDTLEFNTETFAYFLSQAGPEINVRAFKIFESLLRIWAQRIDSEMTNTAAEYNIGIEAKRILDAYDREFRGN